MPVPASASMPLLIIAFILSGAAGLIYESIWSRYLGLLVGHSAYAQLIVLVIFLGGMSLGAWLIGERSQRIKYPLRAYAIVELLAGLLGFAFHAIFVGASAFAYDHLFPALAGHAGLTIAKWTLAGVLILPQSILLGTTFPLMTAGAMRLVAGRPGRTLSLMYFANSLGAAVGVLLAGFVLLAWVGLEGTLGAAAALNLAVVALVFLGGRMLGWDEVFDRWQPAAGTDDAADAAPDAAQSREARDRATGLRLLLVVAFGTAAASFVYEIAWIRMLSLVLGSATHSFELMLSAFILGLALGALLVRRYADRIEHPIRTLGIVQVVMGALAIATLPVYMWTFDWIAALQGAAALTDGGYRFYSIARYVLCALIMFPATICAGMTLPLITRTLYMTGAGERAIGRVYSINTLGSIVGVTLAGLVLMPILGVKWLLVAGALVDVALGLVLLIWAWERTPFRNPGFAMGSLVALGGFIFAATTMTRFDATVMSSGVFRTGRVPDPGSHIIHRHVDGRTATVTVKQSGKAANLALLTNGKPDASVPMSWFAPVEAGAPRIAFGGDMGTQVLLALTTMAHAPDARLAAVIGQGSGITSHFMLTSPSLTHLSTIEIEPEIIEASKLFRPVNERVFTDPRAQFVIDDAKSYFAAGARRYDVILSEPSNPWVSGVSGLFTDEFYRRIRTHISDDGVFGQWLHLYEIDDALVLSVLAAIDRNFDDYAIYSTSGLDILVVAKPRGSLPDPQWATVLGWPELQKDLARALPITPDALRRSLIVTREMVHPMLLAGVEPNSDYNPILDLGAERTRYLRSPARGLAAFGTRRFDIANSLSGDTVGFSMETETGLDFARAEAMVRTAAVRAARSGGATGPVVHPNTSFNDPRHRVDLVDMMLRAPAAPSSWRSWFQTVVTADEVLHMGTAGVADETFWQPVLAYAARHDAPREVRAALDMLYGSATWDWPRVIRTAPVLDSAQRAGAPWVNSEMLRDVVVVAHLRQGDPAGADQWLRRLTLPALGTDAAYAFKTRMYFWHVADARATLDGGVDDAVTAAATSPVP